MVFRNGHCTRVSFLYRRSQGRHRIQFTISLLNSEANAKTINVIFPVWVVNVYLDTVFEQ